MIVVAGPRQIGKTTMVRQALAAYPSTYVAADQPVDEILGHFGKPDGLALTRVQAGALPDAE